jgi:CAAX amino terminal protease family.
MPLWILSLFIHGSGLPDNLPLTDVGATFVPIIVGALLTLRSGGKTALAGYIKKVTDLRPKRNILNLVFIVFFYPLLFLLTYLLMGLFGIEVSRVWHPGLSTIVVFLAFLVAAAGEELGYMGFAYPEMEKAYSPIGAALIIGIIHAVWHYPSMIELGQPIGLMITGTAFTIAVRVIIVWLFVKTNRSVAAAVLFHAMGNVCRSIFPGGRSGFERGDAIVGYSLVVISAVIIILMWKDGRSKEQLKGKETAIPSLGNGCI